MTELELKKMSRSELLQMLILQSDENTRLKERVAELEERAAKREIAINQSGTLAEAALKLSGIFEAADLAVAEYHQNIRRLSMDKDTIIKGKLEEAERKAAAIMASAERQAAQKREEAERSVVERKIELDRLNAAHFERTKAEREKAQMETASIVRQAKMQVERSKQEAEQSKREADRYWDELSNRLGEFYKERKGLQEMLDSLGGLKRT